MILSTGRSYVFVHIPKTGGTSMALALEARAMKDDIMIGDTPKARRRRNRVKGTKTNGRLWKHSTLADIEGIIPSAELDRLFAFTLVRNPWDRIVSYYHWLKDQSFEHPAVTLSQRVNFEEFVMDVQTQQTFRAGTAESYMRRADGREQCQAYIRLEHFCDDADLLFQHLGFSLDLPVSNKSQRKRDYRAYYTDKSAEAVSDCCARDITRFGYGFDPVN